MDSVHAKKRGTKQGRPSPRKRTKHKDTFIGGNTHETAIIGKHISVCHSAGPAADGSVGEECI